MNRKKKNITIAMIISSIIIMLGLLAAGLVYMWSQGCDTKVVNSGYRAAQLTTCDNNAY